YTEIYTLSLHDALPIFVEGTGKGGDVVDVVVGSREDGRTAGSANGIGAEAVVETHSLVRNAVDVGSGVDPAVVATHGVCGVIVRSEEHTSELQSREKLV